MQTIADFAADSGPVFLLVFFRVAGVMMLAPVFGSQAVPAAAKIFLSLVIALLFFPLVKAQGAEGPPPS
jgi:flagellar biosynthetic protein FliR